MSWFLVYEVAVDPRLLLRWKLKLASAQAQAISAPSCLTCLFNISSSLIQIILIILPYQMVPDPFKRSLTKKRQVGSLQRQVASFPLISI